jgi:hypothetical protein
MGIKPINSTTEVKAAPSGLPQWEYMTISYSSSYGSTVYRVNNHKTGGLKNKLLNEVLTHFGQEGWELVGIYGTDGRDFVMKRRIR